MFSVEGRWDPQARLKGIQARESEVSGKITE